MQCPECKAVLDKQTTYCSSCGLLLLEEKKKPLRRRAEDFAQQRRRASDPIKASCMFCHGEIDADAVRCRHCAQVLDEDFRRRTLLRRRSQINYASWVAYLFGLLIFIFFKPVGLIAIGVGLLLSIAYYAIPVERPQKERDREPEDGLAFVARQIQPERVRFSLPRLRMKLVFVGTPLFAMMIGYLVNFFVLQQPMNQILRQNVDFKGMYVATRYEYWVVPGVLVYDLRSLDESLNPLHVHAALIEYARNRRHYSFDRVVLKFRGEKRFTMDGAAFRKVGEEFEKGNYEFALFDFAKLVTPEDHLRKIGPEVSTRDALVEFHRIWYADEELRRLRELSGELLDVPGGRVTIQDLTTSPAASRSANSF
jgi:hypothetical protein